MHGSDKRNDTAASSSRRKRRGRWRYVFHGDVAGYCELHDDGWHVFVGRLEVGVVASIEAAQQLIARLKNGGGDA